MLEGRRGGRRAHQRVLGPPGPPGPVRHRAEGDPGARHHAVRQVQHHGDGGQREGVRRPVAGLAVGRGQSGGGRGQDHAGDQLARVDLRVPLGVHAGQPVEVGGGHAPGALGAVQLHARVEGGQRHRHVRGVGGDALVGVAEHRVVPVHALQRAAAGAWLALVAGLGDVLEVRAAGALQQVAAGGGGVAQLPGGAGQQRLGQRRVAVAHGGVGGEVAVADRRAGPQRAVGQLLHGVQRQPGDVDERGGRLHAELHQVDEVGAAAEVAGARVGRERVGGLLDAARAYVGEGLHGITSSTASAMRG